jgi:hypothetical protein
MADLDARIAHLEIKLRSEIVEAENRLLSEIVQAETRMRIQIAEAETKRAEAKSKVVMRAGLIAIVLIQVLAALLNRL